MGLLGEAHIVPYSSSRVKASARLLGSGVSVAQDQWEGIRYRVFHDKQKPKPAFYCTDFSFLPRGYSHRQMSLMEMFRRLAWFHTFRVANSFA
jgi:hypothetical protein